LQDRYKPGRKTLPRTLSAAASLSVALGLSLILPMGSCPIVIGLALLVELSRCYPGVHYPTDVAAGWLLVVMAFVLIAP
jgi:membrane-associated phospholipid phosphatase